MPALVQGGGVVGPLARRDEKVMLDAGAIGNEPDAEAGGELAGAGGPALTRSVGLQLRPNSPGRPIVTSRVTCISVPSSQRRW